MNRRSARHRSGERGQSTVELALTLPLIVLLLLALLQAGILLREQLLVVHAAREGARESAVSPDPRRIRAAAGRAAPGLHLDVGVQRGPRPGDLTTVRVSARPAQLPLVGLALGHRRVGAAATMRVERAGP